MDQRTEGAGRTMGCGGSEWRQLTQAVCVLDRNPRIVSTEYVADQLREPAYATAIQAVQRAIGEEGFRGRDPRSSRRKGVAPVGTQGAST